MIHINKSQEPPELTAFNRTRHQRWEEIHQKANKAVYEACLLQCLIDQKDLCGYTEMKLGGAEFTHIDHYIKRDLAPQLSFDWNNMVAAVRDERFGANYKDAHINLAVYDSVKKEYVNAYNPITDNMVGVFAFSTDGGIEPANKTDVKALGTIKLFHLDDQELCMRRRDCMASVRALRLGGLTDQEIIKHLSPGGFVSAIFFELSSIVR